VTTSPKTSQAELPYPVWKPPDLLSNSVERSFFLYAQTPVPRQAETLLP
jgi:hypothetical protein